MTIVNYNQNPKSSETVRFILRCPDANMCFNSNPFAVLSVTIYQVQRNFASTKENSVSLDNLDKALYDKYLLVNQKLCDLRASLTSTTTISPTEIRLEEELRVIKLQLAQEQNFDTVVYDGTIVYENFGDQNNPIWTQYSTDSILKPITDPTLGINYGLFEFLWDSTGAFAGDYFVCWRWIPDGNLPNNIYADSIYFTLFAEPISFRSRPDTITPTGVRILNAPDGIAYTDFVELPNYYMPETYKTKVNSGDQTPEVLGLFNRSVGQSFEFLRSFIQQIYTLQNANTCPDQFLPFMAGLGNLTLRTTDPTYWRKQVGEMVPNYKMKGTLKGIRQALANANIELLDYQQYWQVVSQYTYTESLYYVGSNEFILTIPSLPISNNGNFAVWLRKAGAVDFVSYPLSDIDITTQNAISTLTWNGPPLSGSQDPTIPGSTDTIKILYQIRPITNAQQQLIENIIRSLPLMDTRDDELIEYPPKNWNTKLILQSDPDFNTLIPITNPYSDPVIFGSVRSIFPYSENVYNSDEYNGSLRKSTYPGDIDKNFIDMCSGSISSCFSVDLSIGNLTSARFEEAKSIINDYKPLHAQLHTLNYESSINDYQLPPEESIDISVAFTADDYLIAGNAQEFFNRFMVAPGSGVTHCCIANALYSLDEFQRNQLSNLVLQGGSSAIVKAFSEKTILYSGKFNFNNIGLTNISSKTYLEILSPYATYAVENPVNNQVEIIGYPTSRPIEFQVPFRLSNIFLPISNSDIQQMTTFYLSDESITLDAFYITTIKDVDNGRALAPWKIRINSTGQIYNIYDLLPDWTIELENNGTLVGPMTSVDFSLYNNSNEMILSSVNGKIQMSQYGVVTINDAGFSVNNKNIVGFYFGETGSQLQYPIAKLDLVNTNKFTIANYSAGNKSGVSCLIYQRIINNDVAFIKNWGAMIQRPPTPYLPVAFTDPQSPTALQDNNFINNYIIKINGNYRKILATKTIGLTEYLILSGDPDPAWAPYPINPVGSNVAVESYQFQYIPQFVQWTGYQIQMGDRAGMDSFSWSFTTTPSVPFAPFASGIMNVDDIVFVDKQNNGSSGGFIDVVNQVEGISVKIEMKSGLSISDDLILEPSNYNIPKKEMEQLKKSRDKFHETFSELKMQESMDVEIKLANGQIFKDSLKI